MIVIRHIKIGVAIVVIVAGRDAHALTRVSQAGRLGDVGEREFAARFAQRVQVELPEEAVTGFPASRQRDLGFALRVRGDSPADQKDVHVAVVVVVDQRGARGPPSPAAGILPVAPEILPESRSRSCLSDILKERSAARRGEDLHEKQRPSSGSSREPDF